MNAIMWAIGLFSTLIGCLPEGGNENVKSATTEHKAVTLAPVDTVQTSKLLPPVVVAEYDLVALELAGAFADIAQRNVQVENDPLYKSGRRRFRGYALNEVLDRLEDFSSFSTRHHSLVWVCADGYRTTYEFHSINGNGGVLATGLTDTEGHAWQSYKQGKRTMVPAPFYLVWEGEGINKQRPWPYQLTKLQIVSTERIAMRLSTPDPEAHGEGDRLYKKHCMSCHSMNLIGGIMGPEMNVPRNILEYRSESDFIAFAANPQAFRARSAMIKMRYLGEDKLKKITGYVKSMSARKVCVTAMGCAEYADGLE